MLKLNKALYGLKQSSRCWNDKFNRFLLNYGFVRSNSDYCLYSKFLKDSIVYLMLYVDDIILAGSNLNNIEECKSVLLKEFEMKDKDDLKYFLGLEINYNRDLGILRIGQEHYLNEILKRFNFENCNACATPIDQKLKLVLNKNDNEHKPTKELIGCLMYLMLGTRPDISFVINYLSRYQDRNSGEVWIQLKSVEISKGHCKF